MKILKLNEFHKRILKNIKILNSQNQNNETTNLFFRIPYEIYENHENIIISLKNNETFENLRIPFENQKNK